MAEIEEISQICEEATDLEEETLVTEEGFLGEYPEITAKIKEGKKLDEKELDTIADIALTTLRDILGFFDCKNASIDEYDGDDNALILDVNSGDLAVLIGRHGRTLESLQTLVSLLVSRRLGFRYPLMIDIEGYKNRRHEKVVRIARSAAARAKRNMQDVNLPPMSPYERRLVHIALREDEAIKTHSEGVDYERHVVITLV